MISKITSFTSFFLLTIALCGCDMTEKKQVPSDDVVALRNIVKLEIPVLRGKYEIFSTPETSDSVPGPTDYVILVGEFEITQNQKINTSPVPGMWLVPNATRPWLSEPFKSLLQKHRSSKIPEDYPGCHQLIGFLTKDNQRVEGIKCIRDEKMFVYLPLFSTDM
jgi:hypothetical protein